VLVSTDEGASRLLPALKMFQIVNAPAKSKSSEALSGNKESTYARGSDGVQACDANC
jgi:hypothetical protein